MDSLNRETPAGLTFPPVLKKTQSRFICDAKNSAVFSANYIKKSEDNKTGRFFFSNVTKDQQKNLRNKLNEERKQYIEQSLNGFFDKQGNVPGRSL